MAKTQLDPIQILGLVNQFKAPAPDNKALRDLQTKGAISNLNNRSLEDRTAAVNASGERKNALPFGLDPTGNTPGFVEGLGRLEQSTLGKRGAETGSLLKRAGFDLTQPDVPVLPGAISGREFSTGFELPGAAQARVAGELAGEASQGEEITDAVDPATGKPVGTLGTRKRTTGSKVSGKVKSVNPANARAFVQIIQQRFPDVVGEATKVVDTGTHLEITIGGRTFRVKK